jgi:hypothetical protein
MQYYADNNYPSLLNMDNERPEHGHDQDLDPTVRETGGDQPDELEDLRARIREIRGRLKEGGPPVSLHLLVDYVDGDLAQPDRRQVAQAIVTWKDWYDAYLDTRSAIEATMRDGYPRE